MCTCEYIREGNGGEMKKKHILNLCMIVTIVLIAVCGIMAVGSVKGWFGGQSVHSDMTVMSKTGYRHDREKWCVL